jgi:predicted ATPase
VLSHFRAQGFKSLVDVEIDLAPLVVLMGPNAAGKSNLLEALLLLSRLATKKTLSAALAPPLRGYPLEAFTLPEGGLEALLQQDHAELTLEAVIQPSRSNGEEVAEPLQYRVSVRIQPKTGALSVTDESLTRTPQNGDTEHKSNIVRSGQSLIAWPQNRWHMGIGHEIGQNHTLVSDHSFAKPDFSEIELLRHDLSAWQTYYLDPLVAMREPQPPREVTDIGPRGEWIAPFLYRLKQSETLSKYFRAIGRALQQAIPIIESLDVELDPRRGTLDILIRQDGTLYSSRVMSEGTLRVLALCCLAANPWPGELIAFEEPENGVHPRRIEVIADLLASMASEGRSQVVVTTHSPTLIAAMLHRAKERPGQIKLFQCSQIGMTTQVKPFEIASSLFEDPEIRQALTGPEDAQIVEALLKRGWLDG